MASKIIVLATVLAACNAVPIWFNEVLPGTIVRVGRAPISYGFGTGFASNIGGIKHATGYGTSFSSGNGESAYASGLGVADGNYARGVGVASAGNAYPVYQAQPTYQAQPAYIARPTYNNAVASAQNYNNGYNSATSSALNTHGLGYESAFSSANNNGFGRQNAISAVHAGSPGYESHAISSAERDGLVKGSSAQTLQRFGNAVQSSGASSIQAPGLQAAQSHAVQTNFY